MDKEKAIEKVLCILEKKFKYLTLEKTCGQRRVIYKDGCEKAIMLEESQIYVPAVKETKRLFGIDMYAVIIKKQYYIPATRIYARINNFSFDEKVETLDLLNDLEARVKIAQENNFITNLTKMCQSNEEKK
jgi:hypothetical protein